MYIVLYSLFFFAKSHEERNWIIELIACDIYEIVKNLSNFEKMTNSRDCTSCWTGVKKKLKNLNEIYHRLEYNNTVLTLYNNI